MYKISSTTNAQHGGVSPSSMDDEGRVRKGSHHQNALPPLFWYMETGDWEKATERAKRHPREVKTWATLRTKSAETAGNTKDGKISGAKRLALHHACFKLRSSVSENGLISTGTGDPFMAVCKFILLLLDIYPDAAGIRESRHGCLPLHLAAFASCTRTSDDASAMASAVSPVGTAYSWGSMLSNLPSPIDAATSPGGIPKPPFINRSASESTSDTFHTNISAVLAEEHYTGSQTMHRATTPSKKHRRSSSASSSSARVAHMPSPTVSVSMSSNILISEKREEMAVRVLNALLDAYPRGIRMDSEGGRLPLHTACAGRATPRVISTLVTAYPAAARHRNRDGFLPLRESPLTAFVQCASIPRCCCCR